MLIMMMLPITTLKEGGASLAVEETPRGHSSPSFHPHMQHGRHYQDSTRDPPPLAKTASNRLNLQHEHHHTTALPAPLHSQTSPTLHTTHLLPHIRAPLPCPTCSVESTISMARALKLPLSTQVPCVYTQVSFLCLVSPS